MFQLSVKSLITSLDFIADNRDATMTTIVTIKQIFLPLSLNVREVDTLKLYDFDTWIKERETIKGAWFDL